MAVNGLYYTDVPLSNYSLTHFSAVRQRYFRVDTLKELFENVDSRNIIAFIKDINFYHRI